MDKIVYVIGYPKSGTTWGTRLVGRMLNCPTGGRNINQDKYEIATEGKDRVSNWVVRKGHFILKNRSDNTVVGPGWNFNFSAIGRNKAVFILRDPRDIIMSGSAHWQTTPGVFFKNMVNGKGGVRAFPPWNEYVCDWLINAEVFLLKYEDLHRDWVNSLLSLQEYLGVEVLMKQMVKAYESEKFEVRKRHVERHGDSYPQGKKFNQKFMRKGIVGDWKNGFSQTLAKHVDYEFGNLMLQFGYVDSRNWWREEWTA